jgi:hypothetical protein
MAHWINTTITTVKGPQGICINTDHIKYIRQRGDGQALVVFAAHGDSQIIDDSYAKVINLIVPPDDVSARLTQHMEVLDQA